MEGIKMFIKYAELGYDVSFTTIYGKSGIQMIQRQTGTTCQQIINYDTLDFVRLTYILDFMYNEIHKTEKYKISNL